MPAEADDQSTATLKFGERGKRWESGMARHPLPRVANFRPTAVGRGPVLSRIVIFMLGSSTPWARAKSNNNCYALQRPHHPMATRSRINDVIVRTMIQLQPPAWRWVRRRCLCVVSHRQPTDTTTFQKPRWERGGGVAPVARVCACPRVLHFSIECDW